MQYIPESEAYPMGDIVKKPGIKPERRSLEERAAERDWRKQSTARSENETIDNLAKKAGCKDRAISARVNGATYLNFKRICAARGITSNACLNMLITDFVRENKKIIEE